MDSDGGVGADMHLDHGAHGHGAHDHGLAVHDAALLALHADQERRARRKLRGLGLLVVAAVVGWVLYRMFA